MKLEVQEYIEKEEVVEEETIVSVKEEGRPKIENNMETETSQENNVGKEETKRIKEFDKELWLMQHKPTKASFDRTSAQSKLRDERAANQKSKHQRRRNILEATLEELDTIISSQAKDLGDLRNLISTTLEARAKAWVEALKAHEKEIDATKRDQRIKYHSAGAGVMPTWHDVGRRYDTGGVGVPTALAFALSHQRFVGAWRTRSDEESVGGEGKKKAENLF
ncbi:hypothetical protein Tco_1350267 [Tanacetum coccineum]